MVWLRNNELEMGNLNGKTELNGEVDGLVKNGTNEPNGTNGLDEPNGTNGNEDRVFNEFNKDDLHDTSNESIHVDDEITINIRPPGSPYKQFKSPRSTSLNEIDEDNSHTDSVPVLSEDKPTLDFNATVRQGGPARALTFEEFNVEDKTDRITSSPKDIHLKPERWKFKTRKKKKKMKKGGSKNNTGNIKVDEEIIPKKEVQSVDLKLTGKIFSIKTDFYIFFIP